MMDKMAVILSGKTVKKNRQPLNVGSGARGDATERISFEKAAWKLNKTAYIAGFLFLSSAIAIFILTGISQASHDTRLVQFTLSAPLATSVSLVGDFNSWDPDAGKMIQTNGIWEKKIRLESGQVYTYNFVIDGDQWITDPASLTSVDDGFGGESSVLKM